MAHRNGSREPSGPPEIAAASHESQVRRQLAQDMIATTPLAWDSLGLEIALTGSASRGLADVDSDIEPNVWGQTLPAPNERGIWLRAVGATEVAIAVEVTEDGTTWDRWRWGDVWVETGWQAIPQLEAYLQEALRAERTDHALVTRASRTDPDAHRRTGWRCPCGVTPALCTESGMGARLEVDRCAE